MKKTLLFFILGSLISVLIVNGKKNGEDFLAERQRKADYIFMESMKQYADDNAGDYFNLLRLARNIDPDDNFYAGELGYFMALLAERDTELDSALFVKAFDMLRTAFDNNPDDLYSAMRYAALCQHFGLADESLRVWQLLHDRFPAKPDVAFSLAENFFQRGDTASIHQALKIYNALERSQGESIGLSSQKIRAFITLRDTTSAINEVYRLINRSPSNPQNQLYAGDIFMAIQLPDSALKHYNRAIELDSTNGVAYHKLAEFYQFMGDSVAYDREVFNALTQSNLEATEKIELMRGYVQNLFSDESQRPRIDRLFEALTTMHPHEADIRDFYSAYLAAIGEYGPSAEQTAITVDLNPSEITNWNRLINLYLILNDYDKAIDAGLQGMHYFPDDATLKLLTSSAYMLDNRYLPAIELLQKALEETDSTHLETISDIETTLGDAFYKIELTDSAFAHYDRALLYNPANIMAMNNCAYFLACENRDLDKAERLSYITVRDDAQNPVYLDTYAWVLFKKGNYSEAKKYIDLTMEADNEPSAELFEHAGDIYFMNLLPAEALDYWKTALELEPENNRLKRKVKEKRIVEP